LICTILNSKTGSSRDDGCADASHCELGYWEDLGDGGDANNELRKINKTTGVERVVRVIVIVVVIRQQMQFEEMNYGCSGSRLV